MKILFVAPRFHTNQVPIVNNLKKLGHDVEFYVQYVGETEDHSNLKPFIIQPSMVTKFIFKLIEYIYDSNVAEKKKGAYFSPAIYLLYKNIRRFSPDIVFLRGSFFKTIPINYLCKVLKINCVYYDQNPIYHIEEDSFQKNYKLKIKYFLKKYHLPKVRISPVKVKNASNLTKKQQEYIINPHEYFIPLVAETNNELARNYFKGDNINILSVGKYRDYKNHFLLVDAIHQLKDIKSIKVKIVGQAKNEEEIKYFCALKEYIYKHKLQDTISIEKNIDYKSMKAIYMNSDVFILTSKKEVASIAILEAMSNGLVAISTDMNGTATYIEYGLSGYTFSSMDCNSLSKTIEKLLNDKIKIERMGRAAYTNIYNNYSFNNYYIALSNVIRKEFDISLIENK